MSSNRPYASRRDASEPLIVQTLERAGYEVERLPKPADLRARKGWYPHGINMILEVKTLTKTGRVRVDKRQVKQNSLVSEGGALRVGTPEAALEALRMFELLISP